MSDFMILFSTLTSIVATTTEEPLFSGTNQFTTDVYNNLFKKGDDNFLVSPFSAEAVLALVQSGAQGDTLQELRTTLHLPVDQKLIENHFKSLLKNLKSNDIYTLRTVTKLYIKKNLVVKDEFKQIAADVFGTTFENIDFADGEAADNINQWVQEQTNDEICDLISTDRLSPLTTALLISAFSFKANWATPFDNALTTKRNFYRLNKEVVQVDTMHRYDTELPFKYCENEELNSKFLELRFESGDATMVLVLPNERDGIVELEKEIDKIFLPQNFSLAYVDMSIPKFKTESTIDFKKILQDLGVSRAFTPGQADFGGISDGNLLISEIIQKTFVEVSEVGVDAAAATYLGMEFCDEQFDATPGKEFHADHPFIYFLKIRNLIVFAGKVGAPTS